MKISTVVILVLAALVISITALFFTRYENIPTPNNGTREQHPVKLFYYNEDLDKDEAGNIQCSKEGLVPVGRTINSENLPAIEETIRMLITGDLTEAERMAGISTEYPLSELTLQNASLQNGLLTLIFNDPQNVTVGGACRVNILRLQIEETAMQFQEVEMIRILPEELFQP